MPPPGRARSNDEECICTPRRSKTYWRLTCTKHMTVTEARAGMGSFYCFKSAHRERVVELFRRAERGLLSYDRYTKPELRVFVNNRYLQNTIPASMIRKDTIAHLESADDDATFDRFLSLPPELRVRIYELHFDAFSTVFDPVQPPISKVSKLVREEALPLFYQRSRFYFAALFGVPYANEAESITRDYYCSTLQRLNKEQLACIRKIELGGRGIFQSWLVDISPAEKHWNMQGRSQFPHLEDAPVEDDALEKMVKDIAERDAPRELRRSDLEALLEVFR